MAISLQCPGCEKRLKIKDELTGKRVKCPSCGQVIVVPGSRPTIPNKEITPPSSKLPVASKEKPLTSPPPVPLKLSKRLRWPWYAGGGVMALCVVTGLVVIFVISGKGRKPASTPGTVEKNTASFRKRGSLVGHADKVGKVAFSPDGKTLASAAGDKTIRLWDIVNLACRQKIERNNEHYEYIIFSPDGNLLATATEKGPLVWNVATGKTVTLSGNAQHVVSVTFSADGKVMASGQRDGMIQFWDVTTRKQSRNFTAHSKGMVVALAFSPDGKRLASCASKIILNTFENIREEIEVKMWDVSTHKELNSFTKVYNHVPTFGVFSPDATAFLVPGAPLKFDLYDVSTGEFRRSFFQHGEFFPNTPVFSSDGKRFLQNGYTWIALTDVVTGSLLAEIKDLKDIAGVAYSLDGKVVAASQGHNVELWDVILGP